MVSVAQVHAVIREPAAVLCNANVVVAMTLTGLPFGGNDYSVHWFSFFQICDFW